LVAIVVGIMAGFGVRQLGKGYTQKFQILGAVMALVGCLAGNVLAALASYARAKNLPFLEVLAGLDPAGIPALLQATFRPMDLLFYGIAVYEGYKFALNHVPQEEIAKYLIPER